MQARFAAQQIYFQAGIIGQGCQPLDCEKANAFFAAFSA